MKERQFHIAALVASQIRIDPAQLADPEVEMAVLAEQTRGEAASR